MLQHTKQSTSHVVKTEEDLSSGHFIVRHTSVTVTRIIRCVKIRAVAKIFAWGVQPLSSPHLLFPRFFFPPSLLHPLSFLPSLHSPPQIQLGVWERCKDPADSGARYIYKYIFTECVETCIADISFVVHSDKFFPAFREIQPVTPLKYDHGKNKDNTAFSMSRHLPRRYQQSAKERHR